MDMYAGMEDRTSALIELGLDRANRDRAIEVYTVHILVVAYNTEYREFLEKATGLSKRDIEKAYNDMVLHEQIKLRDDKDSELVAVDDFHSELLYLLEDCEKLARATRVRMEPINFLRVMLSGKTYAKSMLIKAGVSINRLNQLKPVEILNSTLMNCTTNLNMKNILSKDCSLVERTAEVRKVMETMGRKNKRNPLLIGDAGVGKTAIVESLVDKIVNNKEVPEYLKGKIILDVDISSIVGGSQYRGTFEAKFNSLLQAAERAENVILFFDEFHILLRAGGGNSDNDLTAANIMKPALARQFLPIIGATTTKEYNKHIESDEALSRRFETIMINEPSKTDTIKIVSGAIKSYEKFHNAKIDSEVIEYAVKLTDRYMTNKKQPDKTLTVIDQACAHLKMKCGDTDRIIKVTKDDIKDTVARITDIEIGDLTLDEFAKLKGLDDKLKESVIGQDDAVKAISDAIRRNKIGISSHDKPIGTFLFVGPTGVGKTELCKRISDEFSGRKNNLIRLDMSEYMEKHSVSRMIGSPPGYVGHEEGGQLTDAVRRNPYSVILFDEIEKAHKDVFNILLQILDDGRLTDSQGRVVDFCNTIIIMTSNAGYGLEKESKPLGFGADSGNPKISDDKAHKALEKTFRPEFLNRLDKVVVFNSLSKENCEGIANLMLNKLSDMCEETGVHITFDRSIVNSIVENGFDDKYGARNLKRYIQNLVESKIADSLVSGEMELNKKYRLAYRNGEIKVYKARGVSKKSSIDENIAMVVKPRKSMNLQNI